MVELLSEYEATGNSLLMKHRDHYSHSVYVFALGLAIYECSESYRDKFRDFYGLGGSPENERANRFRPCSTISGIPSSCPLSRCRAILK